MEIYWYVILTDSMAWYLHSNAFKIVVSVNVTTIVDCRLLKFSNIWRGQILADVNIFNDFLQKLNLPIHTFVISRIESFAAAAKP